MSQMRSNVAPALVLDTSQRGCSRWISNPPKVVLRFGTPVDSPPSAADSCRRRASSVASAKPNLAFALRGGWKTNEVSRHAGGFLGPLHAARSLSRRPDPLARPSQAFAAAKAPLCWRLPSGKSSGPVSAGTYGFAPSRCKHEIAALVTEPSLERPSPTIARRIDSASIHASFEANVPGLRSSFFRPRSGNTRGFPARRDRLVNTSPAIVRRAKTVHWPQERSRRRAPGLTISTRPARQDRPRPRTLERTCPCRARAVKAE